MKTPISLHRNRLRPSKQPHLLDIIIEKFLILIVSQIEKGMQMKD